MPARVLSRLLLPLVIALAALFGWAVGDAHAQRPDLVVSVLSAVPNEVPVSGETTVTVSVRNLGSSSAPGYRVRFYFRESTVSRSTSNYRLTELNGSPISPGQVITSELAVALPDSFGSNDYYLDARVSTTVSEWRTSNNWRSVVITVYEPEPAPSDEPPAGDPPAGGLVYYVASNGNDGNPGTETAPFRTLDRGVSVLTPGDTLYVKQGTYAEWFFRNIPAGESWERPVTVAAYPGHTVVLRPGPGAESVARFDPPQAFIILDGLVLDGTYVDYDVVKITGDPAAHHIRIQNCEIKNSRTGHGVVINGTNGGYNEILNNHIHHNGLTPDGGSANHGIYVQADHNLIRGNEIDHHTTGYGIHLFNDTQSYNTIERNRIHDNGDGILVNGDQNLIALNVLWNNGWAIIIGSGNRAIAGNQVLHNTLDANVTGIATRAPASGTVIRNNIVQRSQPFPDDSIINDASGSTIENNLVDRGISSSGSGTTLTDNLTGRTANFVNASARDYHLQAASPARGTGLDLTEIPTDFDDLPWPSPRTIGAFR